MKIRGTTVVTPVPKPDWNQTDPTKADYIKNKPAPEVVNAEYDYETKELLSNFGEMCTAFLEGKIVTLSTTDPMGVKETHTCIDYDPEEMSGYEGSCLIFTQAGPTYTNTLYVTANGVVAEYNSSFAKMKEDIDNIQTDIENMKENADDGESNVFNVVYSNDLGSILCDFADIRKAYHEGKIIRFRYVLDAQDYFDYYLSYYFDNGEVEEYMNFIGGGLESVGIIRLNSDGSWSAKSGKLVSEGAYDELLSRIQTCEEYLGIGVGPGPGESGEIYINGTPYWIDYPKTFDEMINSGIPSDLWVESIINPGEMDCHIGIDYENFAVFWNEIDQDGAMQPVGHIYFNGQTGWVAPDTMVYPGEEYIVVRDI